MARMPIDVVDIGDVQTEALVRAIDTANSLQSEFFFARLTEHDADPFRMHSFNRILASEFLCNMESLRKQIGGYHPFLIAIVDADMDGDELRNLFASNDSSKGLGLVSIANVEKIIVPAGRLAAYILYYLAHQVLGFLVPNHKNHSDTRNCVFDRKIFKMDLLKSMRERALCNSCRTALLQSGTISARQLAALDVLYGASGKLLRETNVSNSPKGKPRVFVGSATEGLKVAHKIQANLNSEFEIEVWNQGTTFGLGTATLEALEAAVLSYDFGIFVFTPTDELHSRGEVKQVARDNVVFELGLFIGKLTRMRVFVVRPKSGIALPSDLAGITTASYDPSQSNLTAALGPACDQVRDAIASALSRQSADSMSR